MGVDVFTGICGPVPPVDVCIPGPAGGEICLSSVKLGIQNPLEQAIKLFDAWISSFLPAMPGIILFIIVNDSVNVIKSIIKLIPGLSLIPGLDSAPDPASAIAQLLSDLAQLAGLAPPLQLPILIVGIIKGLRFFFDSLDKELAFLIANFSKLNLVRAIGGLNPSMGAGNHCATANLQARVAYLNKTLNGPTFTVLKLVKIMICLATPPLPKIPLPIITVIDPNALDDARTAAQAARQICDDALALLGIQLPGSQLTC